MGKEKRDLHVLIITGLSGAGKTQTINCLEDFGYYCVDNLPPLLLTKFIELSLQAGVRIDRAALVIDVRGGEFFNDLSAALKELSDNSIDYEILFLEASEEVLVRRFKESRRRHPLASKDSLLDAIQKEKTMLEELRGQANLIIDTSSLSPRKLKTKLSDHYSRKESDLFSVSLVSFGYKLGIPLDADIIMDVRFLPNPYYDPDMKKMTGEDKKVQDFVLESAISKDFNKHFIELLTFLIPNYINEGKTNLAVAIGCTGGQHRSVALVDYIAKVLNEQGFNAIVRHRDVSRYKMGD